MRKRGCKCFYLKDWNLWKLGIFIEKLQKINEKLIYFSLAQLIAKGFHSYVPCIAGYARNSCGYLKWLLESNTACNTFLMHVQLEWRYI